MQDHNLGFRYLKAPERIAPWGERKPAKEETAQGPGKGAPVCPIIKEEFRD